MNHLNQNTKEWVESQLKQKLHPTYLEVLDQGWQHIGHAEEGAGHFLVRIACAQFTKDKTLVDCHRLVYDALEGAVGTTIHALQIDIQIT